MTVSNNSESAQYSTKIDNTEKVFFLKILLFYTQHPVVGLLSNHLNSPTDLRIFIRNITPNLQVEVTFVYFSYFNEHIDVEKKKKLEQKIFRRKLSGQKLVSRKKSETNTKSKTIFSKWKNREKYFKTNEILCCLQKFLER